MSLSRSCIRVCIKLLTTLDLHSWTHHPCARTMPGPFCGTGSSSASNASAARSMATARRAAAQSDAADCTTTTSTSGCARAYVRGSIGRAGLASGVPPIDGDRMKVNRPASRGTRGGPVARPMGVQRRGFPPRRRRLRPWAVGVVDGHAPTCLLRPLAQLAEEQERGLRGGGAGGGGGLG